MEEREYQSKRQRISTPKTIPGSKRCEGVRKTVRGGKKDPGKWCIRGLRETLCGPILTSPRHKVNGGNLSGKKRRKQS